MRAVPSAAVLIGLAACSQLVDPKAPEPPAAETAAGPEGTVPAPASPPSFMQPLPMAGAGGVPHPTEPPPLGPVPAPPLEPQPEPQPPIVRTLGTYALTLPVKTTCRTFGEGVGDSTEALWIVITPHDLWGHRVEVVSERFGNLIIQRLQAGEHAELGPMTSTYPGQRPEVRYQTFVLTFVDSERIEVHAEGDVERAFGGDMLDSCAFTAHGIAQLDTTPAEVLDGPVKDALSPIELAFDEPIELEGLEVQVTDGGGLVVPHGEQTLAPNRMSLRVSPSVPWPVDAIARVTLRGLRTYGGEQTHEVGFDIAVPAPPPARASTFESDDEAEPWSGCYVLGGPLGFLEDGGEIVAPEGIGALVCASACPQPQTISRWEPTSASAVELELATRGWPGLSGVTFRLGSESGIRTHAATETSTPVSDEFSGFTHQVIPLLDVERERGFWLQVHYEGACGFLDSASSSFLIDALTLTGP